MTQPSSKVIWRSIKGYEGYYEVSNTGLVRSVLRLIKIKDFNKSYPSKVLKSYKTSRGYELVKLCKEGVVKSFSVHRLVALTFLSNKEGLPEVNHIDGDKLNNNLSNLEWCTSSENQKHAFENGLQIGRKGSYNGMSSLTECEVLFLHYWKSKGHFAKELSKIFNYSKNHIQDILGFRKWSHLRGEVLQ